MIDPFIPCRRCSSSILPDGFILRRDGTASECECHIEWREKQSLKLKLEKSNIASSIINRDFKDYIGNKSIGEIEKLKKFVERFKELGYKKCLYVHGPHGTQKTTAVQIVGKEILKQNFSVFYIRSMDLIVKHFNQFNPTEEDTVFIQRAEESDLVIIDECFARKRHESVSDYQLIALRNFLKNRLEIQEKSTIFISNYSIQEIQKQGFDRGIYDLIYRNTIGKVLLMEDNYNEEVTQFDIDELFQ